MAAKAEQLDRARARWRSLRLQRSSLSQKLTTLGVPSSHSQVPNAAPVPSIHRFAGCNLYRHCNDLLRRSQLSVASRGCIKLKLQRSTFPTTAAASSHDEYKPLSTYLRLEPISFASVSKFLHLRGVGQSPTTFNLMPHAICEYQQSVATAAGVSVSDICWFQQWPSETLDCLHPPSLTTGAASPECSLTASLCFPLAALESLFLVMEHEALSMAQNPSFTAPVHPCLDQGPSSIPLKPPYPCPKWTWQSPDLPSLFVFPPTPPDPAVLSRTYVICGVNQRMLLRDAIDGALKPMLREYHASLPRDKWRAVCMQSMRVTQAVVDALRAAPAAPASSSSTPTSREHSTSWSALTTHSTKASIHQD